MASVIVLVYVFTISLLFGAWFTRQIINYKKDTYYAEQAKLDRYRRNDRASGYLPGPEYVDDRW
jgi:hypothetical protein